MNWCKKTIKQKTQNKQVEVQEKERLRNILAWPQCTSLSSWHAYWKVFLRKDKADWGNRKYELFSYTSISSVSSFPISSLPGFLVFLAVPRDIELRQRWVVGLGPGWQPPSPAGRQDPCQRGTHIPLHRRHREKHTKKRQVRQKLMRGTNHLKTWK